MLGSLPFAPKPRLSRKYGHWVCRSTEDGHDYIGAGDSQAEAYELWRSIDRSKRLQVPQGEGLSARFWNWLVRPSV